MPGFDKTGPGGQGPLTGGGRGYCAPGRDSGRGAGRGGVPWGGGRGRCFGGGRGRGWGGGGGHRWGGRGYGWGGGRGYGYALPWGVETSGWVPDEETAVLRNHAARLEQELQAIKDRLAAMEQNAAAADEK